MFDYYHVVTRLLGCIIAELLGTDSSEPHVLGVEADQ